MWALIGHVALSSFILQFRLEADRKLEDPGGYLRRSQITKAFFDLLQMRHEIASRQLGTIVVDEKRCTAANCIVEFAFDDLGRIGGVQCVLKGCHATSMIEVKGFVSVLDKEMVISSLICN